MSVEANNSRRTVSIFVKIAVLFHVLCITIWALPNPPQTPRKLVGSDHLLDYNQRILKESFIRHYLIWSGTWQYWDMFSPNPANRDVWIDAVITYDNGDILRYRYPRIYELDLFHKYLKERYRKFLERSEPEEYQWVWPSFAQRIALEATSDKNNLPKTVLLRRYWRVANPPGQPTQFGYNMYPYYTYLVDQKKLREVLR